MSNLPTLYDLSSAYQELLRLSASDDLPEQALADTLEGLAGDIQTKGINYVKVAQSLKAVNAAKRAAGKELVAAADRGDAQADRILDWLQLNMERTGITEISCEYFTARLRTNPPAVKIADGVVLPDAYMMQPAPPPPRPNKVSIKRAIESGIAIDGCWLESTQRLEVKP